MASCNPSLTTHLLIRPKAFILYDTHPNQQL